MKTYLTRILSNSFVKNMTHSDSLELYFEEDSTALSSFTLTLCIGAINFVSCILKSSVICRKIEGAKSLNSVFQTDLLL